ncbi:hypothetical protein HJFPF1_05092 [Paramyrothecium foliicola]|nr:hypothetical protein HJFPF1_05092 [Paramyrothecium foliicola]
MCFATVTNARKDTLAGDGGRTTLGYGEYLSCAFDPLPQARLRRPHDLVEIVRGLDFDQFMGELGKQKTKRIQKMTNYSGDGDTGDNNDGEEQQQEK